MKKQKNFLYKATSLTLSRTVFRSTSQRLRVDLTSSVHALIHLYKDKLALQEAEWLRIEQENALAAEVYKILHPNGKEYIFKICPSWRDYMHEKYFLTYFSKKLPVPKVIQWIEPSFKIPGAILMECLPGKSILEADLTDSIAYEIGILLGKIHENRTPKFGDFTKPEGLSDDPRTYFLLKFEKELAECTLLSKSLLKECHLCFQSLLETLTQVDGPCVVHRDLHLGNIIIHEGVLQGIIDWSSAVSSFAQEDFYFLGDNEWGSQALIKNAFLEGYKSIRPIPDYTSMMPLIQLGKAIHNIKFTIKRNIWDEHHTALYKKYYERVQTIIG
jgi:hypothetical protein